MKIDFVFLLKAVNESETIFIYRKEKDKTQRYFSRFFQLQSKEQSIIIDYPYTDGYTPRRLEKDDPISVVFNSAGFRFQFDSTVKEKIELSTGYGIETKIPALKIAWPDEILDGNRRSLFRAAVYLDKSVKVKYKIMTGTPSAQPTQSTQSIQSEPVSPLPGGGESPPSAAFDGNVHTHDAYGEYDGVEALMIDISENGVAVKVNRKVNIETGDKLKLAFRLEEESKEEIEVEGVVRHIREYPGSEIQVWGIEFIPGKTTEYKKSLQKIACHMMSGNRENVSFFSVNQVVSKNPLVRKIVDNEVTEEVLNMLLAKQLPLAPEEYLESLVYVMQIDRFKLKASFLLLQLPDALKEQYVERVDANHRVAYHILTEALNHSYLRIIANMVKNRYLPVEFLREIAEKGSGRMLRILVANRLKLIAYPEIMDVMENNPAVTPSIKGKIRYLKDVYLEEWEAEFISEDEVIPDVTESITEQEALSMLQRINRLSLQERIRLAFTGNRPERMILARDPNKLTVLAVIENPGITGEEILRMTQNKKNSREVIVRVCKDKNWMKNYALMFSILKHPKMPVTKAGEFLEKLNNRDLRQLSMEKDINPAVRDLACYFHDKRK
jgi:c-di-GMP-binding flagellar brake protein YcgR